MKRLLAAFLCFIFTVSLLGGCSDPVGTPIVFEDLIVTLPADFIELSQVGDAQDADLFYGRNTLIVKGLAEKKAIFIKKMTLEEYTSYVISCNQLSCTPEPSGDGYLFTYEATIGDTTYTYNTATFEGETNFWIFQFYCPSANLKENQPEIDIILESLQLKSSQKN